MKMTIHELSTVQKKETRKNSTDVIKWSRN